MHIYHVNYRYTNEFQSNAYSDQITEIVLAGRGWTFQVILSQESSKPFSPQGVCVGTRIKGKFWSSCDSQHISTRGLGLGIGSCENFSLFSFSSNFRPHSVFLKVIGATSPRVS